MALLIKLHTRRQTARRHMDKYINAHVVHVVDVVQTRHSCREPPACASLEARQVRITGAARKAVRKGPGSNWLIDSNWFVISNGLLASKCFDS